MRALARIFLIATFYCANLAAANDGDVHTSGLIDNDSAEADIQAFATRYSNGNINTFRQASSSSSTGGKIQLERSSNWGKSKPVQRRAYASKTFQSGSEDNLRKTIDDEQKEILPSSVIKNTNRVHALNTLHHSFRLPLQRLSDRQLTTLLQRYQQNKDKENNNNFNEMSRTEKVKKLQKLIVNSGSGRLHLIRPTLLTNINVVNEDETLASSPSSSLFSINQLEDTPKNKQFDTNGEFIKASKNSLPDIFENSSNPSATTTFYGHKQENITEDAIETSHIFSLLSPSDDEIKVLKNDNNSTKINTLVHLLKELKARYEKIKQIFNAKLEELNRKRKSLFFKTAPSLAPLIETTETTSTDNIHNSNDNIFQTTTTSEGEKTEGTHTTTLIDEIVKSTETRTEISNPLKHKLYKLPINQGIIDSSFESVVEGQRTYPSELITPKFERSITDTTTTTTISEPEITTEEKSNARELTTIRLEEGISSTKKTNFETNFSTIDLFGNRDPFSEIESSTTSSVDVSDESRGKKLIKKILGLIQYVKNNKTQTASTLPLSDENESKNFKTFERQLPDQEGHNLLIEKITAPKAQQIPKNVEISKNKSLLKQNGEVSAMELLKTLQSENEQQLQKQTEGKNKPKQEHVDLEEKNDIGSSQARFDENSTCEAISCNFEKGSLCQWTASKDELKPGDRQYKNKIRRVRDINASEKKFVQRAWHNWEGRYRNRLTGIARAQIFSEVNRRFAAAYVKPNQRATLSAKILSNEIETIRFHAWEATRDVRLRVCCDSTNENGGLCAFETERGVRRGSRYWRDYTAVCPKGTKKIIFECVNDGLFQGACGVDNIHLISERCSNTIPQAALIENRRRLL